MNTQNKHDRRSYYAPRRLESAEATRTAILAAAKVLFEGWGWSATTVQSVAERAGVSPKTVEAVFGRKAELLRAVVDYSIRGDARPTPMRRREAVAAMEAAALSAMLDLHSAQVRAIDERSARIAWVIEQASQTEPAVAGIWKTMNKHRHDGVRWATKNVLAKSAAHPDETHVAQTFWVATDWATYRNLVDHAGLDPDGFEAWLRNYYRRMLDA